MHVIEIFLLNLDYNMEVMTDCICYFIE